MEAKARAEDAAVAARWREAAATVERGTAAAGDHALAALTGSLKAEPDGRRTLAKARRSRSYAAAEARLTELGADLVGMVRSAREQFYRDAYDHWSRVMPTEFLKAVPPVPTARELSAVRGFPIGGTTVAAEFGALVAGARRRLLAALTRASARGRPASVAVDAVRAWRAREAGTLASAARRALSDSQVFADTAAGWHVARPDLRLGESPLGID